MSNKISVIGVTSEPGRTLFRKLAEQNRTVTGIGRNRQKLAEVRNEICKKFPLTEVKDVDVEQDTSFLLQTDILFHCSQPRLIKYLISDKLSHLIALGSTRKFSQYPDTKHKEVIEMENIITESAVPATILHPTMIYGAITHNNIQRIIKVAKSWPIIPLPLYGKALIQPIHNQDVVKALINCLENKKVMNQSIVIAGPSPMTYREFVGQIIAATGFSCRVVALPYTLIKVLLKIFKYLPNLPDIKNAELKRLLEDKNFDTLNMQKLLNVRSRSFTEGITHFISSKSEG